MSNEDLLPLVPVIVEKAKDRQSTFRLYSTPGVATSVRYDFVMNHLEETDSMREVITFGRNIQKLARGTANHTDAQAADLLNLIAPMVHGNIKMAFDSRVATEAMVLLLTAQEAAYPAQLLAIQTANHTTADAPTQAEMDAAWIWVRDLDNVPQPAPTQATVTAVMQFIIGTVMPFRALAKVRRRLKRQTRKPADMKIRAFVSHFLRINNEELEWIPPFLPSNKLNMDELLEIWQFAIPNSWLRKLAEQGKDPVTMTSTEFLNAVEYLESAEGDFDSAPKSSASPNSQSSKKKKKSNGKHGSDKSNNNGDYYCMYHKKNDTHATADCKILKSLAEGKLKGTSSKTNKKDYKSKNKTYNRDAKKSADDAKKDMAAIIQKAVKAELNSFVSNKKKRKAELNAIDAKADDDTVSLGDFDYEKLEGMSFSDKEIDGEESFATAEN